MTIATCREFPHIEPVARWCMWALGNSGQIAGSEASIMQPFVRQVVIVTLAASTVGAQSRRSSGPLLSAARAAAVQSDSRAVSTVPPRLPHWIRSDSASEHRHWDPVVASVLGAVAGGVVGAVYANSESGPCVVTPGGGPCRVLSSDNGRTYTIRGALVGAVSGYVAAWVANRTSSP